MGSTTLELYGQRFRDEDGLAVSTPGSDQQGVARFKRMAMDQFPAVALPFPQAKGEQEYTRVESLAVTRSKASE